MIGSDLSEEAERASAIGFTSACAAEIPDEIQTESYYHTTHPFTFQNSSPHSYIFYVCH